ncbi:hypothetical protein [Clostridium sp. B9]|uniref:hypothetical protein n=1 Tax=Clostridium sp. B9 TaxID=3423224 RepID=UPI003D2EC288
MKIYNNNYTVTKKVPFDGIEFNKSTYVKEAFDFAYDMSFGGKGRHRDHRSGGQENRKNGQIFVNTFQGKLAELGFYNTFINNGFDISYPDLETYDLGSWDSADFEVKKDNKTFLFSIKSTKSYGNLMLLETKDFNILGEYIPNKEKGKCKYDIFALVRIKPDAESILKSHKQLYCDTIDKKDLENMILNEKWKYDLPGYIKNEDLVKSIKSRKIIPQNSLLNTKTKMDAENYYIETGTMRKFKIK